MEKKGFCIISAEFSTTSGSEYVGKDVGNLNDYLWTESVGM